MYVTEMAYLLRDESGVAKVIHEHRHRKRPACLPQAAARCRQAEHRRLRRPAVNFGNYREEPLYPGIVQAVAAILQRGKVVAPIDVLVKMGLLAPEHLKDWRFGRVPYLEKVINSNLTRLSRLLRVLGFHAHDLNLVPSISAYRRWGNKPRQTLRFTKTGDPKIEAAYARHFVWPGKGPFRPPEPGEEKPLCIPATRK